MWTTWLWIWLIELDGLLSSLWAFTFVKRSNLFQLCMCGLSNYCSQRHNGSAHTPYHAKQTMHLLQNSQSLHQYPISTWPTYIARRSRLTKCQHTLWSNHGRLLGQRCTQLGNRHTRLAQTSWWFHESSGCTWKWINRQQLWHNPQQPVGKQCEDNREQQPDAQWEQQWCSQLQINTAQVERAGCS